PVGLGVVAAGTTLLEPGVLVGGMIEYLVDEDAHATCVRRRDDLLEILQGAEQWIDAAVVGNVVAEVLHRRGEEWRQPDGVDVEAGDVVDLLDDAQQIADAIAVAVEKAAWVNLINDATAPPVIAIHTADLRDEGNTQPL